MAAADGTPVSYVRVCRLSKGGVGRVELALRQEGRFQRLYAVKRLHRHLQEDEEFRIMFLDEAHIAGLIRHPNVVSVLDVGEDGEGPFLVMDYVEGMPLSRLIRSLPEPVPVQVALKIIAQAARGLHAAHELRDHEGRDLQLVHRDISPQNILLRYDGTALVTDFGIAKALGRTSRTATGMLKGKFGYMSPEQLRFEKPDRRADLFALGVVLYELLSGERLYRSNEDYDGVQRILSEAPPDLGLVRPDVPKEVVELLFRMLAKRKEKRPATADEVAQVLEASGRDLAADEGPLEVRDYLDQHFREVREKTDQELQTRIQQANAHLRAQELRSIGPVPDGEDAEFSVTDQAAPTTRHRWWRLGVPSLVAVCLIGGMWFFQARSGNTVTAAPPATLNVPDQSPTTPRTPSLPKSSSPSEDSLGSKIPSPEAAAPSPPARGAEPETAAPPTPPADRRTLPAKRRVRRGARTRRTKMVVTTPQVQPDAPPAPRTIPSLGWDER